MFKDLTTICNGHTQRRQFNQGLMDQNVLSTTLSHSVARRARSSWRSLYEMNRKEAKGLNDSNLIVVVLMTHFQDPMEATSKHNKLLDCEGNLPLKVKFIWDLCEKFKSSIKEGVRREMKTVGGFEQKGRKRKGERGLKSYCKYKEKFLSFFLFSLFNFSFLPIL